MYQSQELNSLTQAIAILKDARVSSVGINFAWKTLNNAGEYLQKQVNVIFADSAEVANV